MNGHRAVRRLAAFAAGKPLPQGQTLRVPKPGVSAKRSEIMIVAFVRMGGESGPWGVAFGRPGKKPELLAVPEPRTRDYVSEMMGDFAPALLEHFLCPRFSDDGKGTSRGDAPELPVRQIWVPNKAHLEMIHCIAYTYFRTKYGAENRRDILQALSRVCGWLFRESQRVGQTITMVASEVLSEAYTFPSDDMRQGHLGFLLAWLQTKGGRVARNTTAEAAELESVSTNLDPELERKELQPLVEEFGDARRDEDKARMDRATKRIKAVIEGELLRRWKLTEAAVDAFGEDKRRENLGVVALVNASKKEHYFQYLRIEQKVDDAEDGPAFSPSPETDWHPAAAGARYYVYASSAELRDRLLVHDDEEMQAELIASGEAIRGEITDVTEVKVGRATHVYWTVETDGTLPLRLRDGATLCPIGCMSQRVQILDIERPDAKTNRFHLQVTAIVRKPGFGDRLAGDRRLCGEEVTLVPPPMDGIQRRKSQAIWGAEGPGAWLTHAVPKGRGNKLPDDVADDPSENKAR